MTDMATDKKSAVVSKDRVAIVTVDVAHAAFMAAWPHVMERLEEMGLEKAKVLMHSIETALGEVRRAILTGKDR